MKSFKNLTFVFLCALLSINLSHGMDGKSLIENEYHRLIKNKDNAQAVTLLLNHELFYNDPFVYKTLAEIRGLPTYTTEELLELNVNDLGFLLKADERKQADEEYMEFKDLINMQKTMQVDIVSITLPDGKKLNTTFENAIARYLSRSAHLGNALAIKLVNEWSNYQNSGGPRSRNYIACAKELKKHMDDLNILKAKAHLAYEKKYVQKFLLQNEKEEKKAKEQQKDEEKKKLRKEKKKAKKLRQREAKKKAASELLQDDPADTQLQSIPSSNATQPIGSGIEINSDPTSPTRTTIPTMNIAPGTSITTTTTTTSTPVTPKKIDQKSQLLANPDDLSPPVTPSNSEGSESIGESLNGIGDIVISVLKGSLKSHKFNVDPQNNPKRTQFIRSKTEYQLKNAPPRSQSFDKYGIASTPKIKLERRGDSDSSESESFDSRQFLSRNEPGLQDLKKLIELESVHPRNINLPISVIGLVLQELGPNGRDIIRVRRSAKKKTITATHKENTAIPAFVAHYHAPNWYENKDIVDQWITFVGLCVPDEVGEALKKFDSTGTQKVTDRTPQDWVIKGMEAVLAHPTNGTKIKFEFEVDSQLVPAEDLHFYQNPKIQARVENAVRQQLTSAANEIWKEIDQDIKTAKSSKPERRKKKDKTSEKSKDSEKSED